MFCDQVLITLIAGKGGDGCVSFRREKFVPFGGPDGGNGGKGGDVILCVDGNLNSLIDLRKKKIYSAESGTAGHRFDKAGRRGEDLILSVPPGTLVFDSETDELLADLVTPEARTVALEGGRGGFGNAHFSSSVRQAPDFAEKGEPGRILHVRLEMQMVADVGIIGLPSVGKSTLISRITKAKPKIADYPFTTLVPNIGVADLSPWGGGAGQSFVVADIPGLIEGAHKGKGLGHEFLRHISRTAVLVHVLDSQSQDMARDYDVIVSELEAYDPELANRPHIVAINKIDTVDEETLSLLVNELTAFFKRKKIKTGPLFAFSAVTGQGLKEFMFHVWEAVRSAHRAASAVSGSDVGHRVFRPHLERMNDGFEVERLSVGFRVLGKRIEQIVVMTNLDNRSAVLRVYDVMEKMGILKRIRAMGATLGDPIYIGEALFEFRG